MPRKISVALFTRSLEVGGAEVQLASLATGLPRDQFQVTVLCLYEIGPLLDPLREAGVRVISLEKSGRWEIARFFVRLLGELRRLQPDVLHAFLGPPNVLAALVKPFLPGTFIVWGVRASNTDLRQYDLIRRWSFKVECWLSRHADLIVANSVAGCIYAMEHGFPKERLTVVPNGIDTALFTYDEAARNALRAEWGVSENECLVGLVGRLDPMKGHEIFLKGAAILAKAKPSVRFVCVGSEGASDRKYLAAMAAKLNLTDRLIWTGYRNDPPKVFSALDIHCSTSIFGEGFSNAIAEAMAVGVPNVVTDVGDSARIVDGLGRVVAPGDPAAFAQACGELVDLGAQGRKPLGRRCTARIAAEFSRPKMIERMAEIYCERGEA